MNDPRLQRLEDLHRRVRQMAEAPWYQLHRRLAEVIYTADGIGPRQVLIRDHKGRFIRVTSEEHSDAGAGR